MVPQARQEEERPGRRPPPLGAAHDTDAEVYEGVPRYAWFGGILEGRREPRSDEALRAAVAALNALCLARAELELEGGRYSVLFSDETLTRERLAGADPSELARSLQRLVDASADPRSVESTLRCTEVYEAEVVETLFAVTGGELAPIGRSRPVQEEDHRRAPRPPGRALSGANRRQLGLLAALFAASFALLAWQGGWLGRMFGTAAAELALDAGPFRELLALELGGTFGDYELRVRRGARYPATAAELDALARGAETTVERAAVTAVGAGGRVHAQLRGTEGELLATAALELGALLGDAEAEVLVRLPGQRGARAVHLSLDPGRSQR